MTRLRARMLPPDGRRLQLQDGPMDLVVQAWGDPAAVRDAYAAAAACAAEVMDGLCAELPLLRSDARGATRAGGTEAEARGPVARRMQDAVRPYAARGLFITPMAAVAGAVADHVLDAMRHAAPLRRAYVNNGGDIALHLEPGEALRAGVAQPGRGTLVGEVAVRAEDRVRGIATSGWPGRSHSLGIADAVTVLASAASAADAAATVVANAVDLPGHPAVTRVPARELAPDSDLGDRPVTRGVGALAEPDIARALGAGAELAEALVRDGLIGGAALYVSGQVRLVGPQGKLPGAACARPLSSPEASLRPDRPSVRF